MKECDKGYNGDCCCNCTQQLELFKHPWNKEPFKGAISESTGLYVCTTFHAQDKNNKGILFTKKHGICECHQPRKI